MTKIKVIYMQRPSGAIGIDMGLDKKIQAFFESLGFEWTGQGFDLEKEERDLGFYSKEYQRKEAVSV